MSVDFFILGQGLMGTCLAWELEKRGADFRIVDRNRERGSSPVAAGLITPITGKGLNPSWKQDAYMPGAKAFYLDLEKKLGQSLWHQTGTMRLFKSQSEISKWRGKSEEKSHSRWVEEADFKLPEEIKNELGGLWMPEGGWVDMAALLRGSRDYFEAVGKLSIDEEFVNPSGAAVIRCEGFAGLIGGGEKIGHRCAKGEILTVKIPNLGLEQVVNRSGWLVPLGEDCYRAGASYEWDELDELPTEKGREQVEAVVRSFTDLPFVVLDHVAGVRPIIRQSIPVVQPHEDDWWINGLGSKGAMYAPEVARQVADEIFGVGKVDPDLSDIALF